MRPQRKPVISPLQPFPRVYPPEDRDKPALIWSRLLQERSNVLGVAKVFVGHVMGLFPEAAMDERVEVGQTRTRRIMDEPFPR